MENKEKKNVNLVEEQDPIPMFRLLKEHGEDVALQRKVDRSIV